MYRRFESLFLRNLKRKLLDDCNLRFFCKKSFRVPKMVLKVCGNHVRIPQKHRINDRYDLEADVVLHLSDGRYALIECKLGSNEIEEGAKHLLQLKKLIIEHNRTEKQNPIREPDLLMILTGGKFATRRADGVHVVPIGCLRP